jgi:hypothetical protein
MNWNCLSGWTIIRRQDLHELSNPANYDVDKRIRDSRREYYQFYKSCSSEVQRRKELKRISEKYNVRESIVLEYVDRANNIKR